MEGIEQALYGVAPLKGYGFLARSPGFQDAWTVAAENLCTRFGERPAGITFTGAMFALPLVSGWVAIVEVRDQGTDDLGRPGSLEFRILAVPVALYRAVSGDPFWIADQFPPDWAARGSLPAHTLNAGPPERTTAQLRPLLQREDSAILLGGAQGLLDGSRLFLTRPGPVPDLVRGLWSLLPDRSRETMWPCTYTFRPRSEFHVQAAPPGEVPPPYQLSEDQAADYPEGRYELALQTAVETGDEAELHRLLQRPSRQQMLYLALVLLALFLIVPISSALMPRSQPETPPPGTSPTQKLPGVTPKNPERKTESRSTTPSDRILAGWPIFAANEVVSPLSDAERIALASQLRQLAQKRGLTLPPGDTPDDLTRQLEALHEQLAPTERGRALQRAAIEAFLVRQVGTLAGDRASRVPASALSITAGGAGQLRDHGPIERQLRVLLWIHGSPDHQQQGPNTLELLEKLEARLP